jgi:hypothetical protein
MKAIIFRREWPVIPRAGKGVGVLRRWHAHEGHRRHGKRRRTEVQHFIVHECEEIGGRAGLAEIAAVIAHGMKEDTLADAVRDLFRGAGVRYGHDLFGCLSFGEKASKSFG